MNLPCAFSQDSSDPDDSIRCWKSVIRRHLREKLTGQARYSAALKLPGMLHGQVRRSPPPMPDNGYKVTLAANLVKRAVAELLAC